ncbi:MAG: protein kinase [Burkholderiaceae bacterium]
MDSRTSAERLVYGLYQVLEEVGEGATSIVYRAQHRETGDIVALKVMRFDSKKAKMARRLRKLFMTEAALATRVQHPNIVQIYAAEIEDDCAYIAMEYVQGVPLREFCTFDKLLPPHRVVEVIFKCAMALDFAGRRGIVHRDIKPDNILLSNEGDVKVMDFGLALNLRKSGADSTFIMGVGSPAYMSPEQIKDYPLNIQSDLYSLGAVMFEMLTGRLPYRAKNRAALMYKIINMDSEPVSILNPSVPEQLDPVVKKALEKDLYSRYRTGIEMAQDLSGAKFQILDDADSVKLSRRFKMVRQCASLFEFENDEIWEILRISHWREYNELRQFMTEGDEGASFGVLLQGDVEVSMKGRRLQVLGAGEVLGELAFFNPGKAIRTTTVVAMTDVIFLEVSPAAYALASEETQEHFRKLVVDTLVKRVTANNEKLIETAPPARAGVTDSEFQFDLVPMEGEYVPMRPAREDLSATSIILTSGGDILVVEDDPVNSRGEAQSFIRK